MTRNEENTSSVEDQKLTIRIPAGKLVVSDPLVQQIAREHPDHLKAYNNCIKYEAELTKFKDKLRYVQTLHFLLLHAPNRDVRTEVAKCIHSCKDRNAASNLGAFFESNLILSFKKHKARTPIPRELPPVFSSFEAEKGEVKASIAPAPRSHKAKDLALLRDNWRCVVTGTLDRRAPNIDQSDPTVIAVDTQSAHIVPAKFFHTIQDGDKLEYSASLLAVLKRFHYDIDKFNGEKIHSLINLLTLHTNIHDLFDELNLYFEPTSEENHYEVKFFGPRPHQDVPQFVTFSSSNPNDLPVPAPELLALHATCCKVAHFAGSLD